MVGEAGAGQLAGMTPERRGCPKGALTRLFNLRMRGGWGGCQSWAVSSAGFTLVQDSR